MKPDLKTKLKAASVVTLAAVVGVAAALAKEIAVTIATVALAAIVGLAVAKVMAVGGLVFPVSLPLVAAFLAFSVRVYEGAKS